VRIGEHGVARGRSREVIMSTSGRWSGEREIAIPVDAGSILGTLDVPSAAVGVVVFAHGSGSSRHSRRNREVAATLREDGLGTFLFDLLTAEEEEVDRVTAELRFDIGLLARRLLAVTAWLQAQERIGRLPLGYFGSSTGAAAALVAAAEEPGVVRAVVSRGGRPDLAGEALTRVEAPTLLIVGGDDVPVIGMNEEAKRRMRCLVELAIVPGATHLFEEPGTLAQVAELASTWFGFHLPERGSSRESG
jgi:putative phosphoribosyl transferase